ncbi:MAG TPA: thioredoxin family protein [Candidatus Dormibacteraeota bacterium]|nr:thioredoxin family protein [Candidatus Dormibacteraeota bacterium]
MSAQLWALAVAGAVVLAAAGLEAFRARRARKLTFAASPSGPAGHLRTDGENRPDPYILYFTGDSCTVCRTHQEPALARLGDVRIDKVDAVEDRALADRFHVYTLPTTVVLASDGTALHVNYGYAPANKLERQLAEARGAGLRSAATA